MFEYLHPSGVQPPKHKPRVARRLDTRGPGSLGHLHAEGVQGTLVSMISSTFFFLFSQLGVGMMLTLLFISPRAIGNSFFKFASLTAAILLGVVLGFNFLFPSLVRANEIPVIFLLISAVLTIAYNRVVALNKLRPAFVLLIAATATGLISIVADSFAFTRLMALGGWENWMLLINHLAATALLGSVMLTMVFGHWYLVIPKLSIDHLARLTKVLIGAIVLRVLTILASLVILEAEQSLPLSAVLKELMVGQAMFFWPRILFGVLVPVILALMIRSTVRIRHTQAATGLLYLAVVALLFGEFFSKFLLFAVNIAL
jgi:hypothetical protein